MKKHVPFIVVVLLIVLGCEEILLEEDLTEKSITLIAPSDGARIENTGINFSWDAVDQATEYRLQIAQPTFENTVQIVEDTTVTATNFSTNVVSGDYEWRVRAQNSGSATAYVSAKFSTIEAEDFAARKVILNTPNDNTIRNTATISLQWQAVTNATIYNIQLLDQNNQVIQEETATGTSIQLTFPEGVTQWQVRAQNDTQNTLYTTRSLTVDTMNPAKPVNTAPADGTMLTNTMVSFTWTREQVEGTAESDSIYLYTDQELTQLATKDRVTSPSEITVTANTYYWFIKAFDEAGNQGESSDVFSFTIN